MLIVRQAPSACLASLRLSPLAHLRTKSRSNALEVVTHAPLSVGRQACSRTGHVVVKDPVLFVGNAEQLNEGSFGSKLDGNDGVPDARENGERKDREVRTDKVCILPANGTDHHKRQTTRVRGLPRLDDTSERADNLLGVVKVLGRRRKKKLSGSQDEVVGDKDLQKY